MKASIITTVRNSRSRIGRVVEACLGVSGAGKEVIVVDRGSTDGSADIAANYPVKLLRMGECEVGEAWSAGLKLATGDVCYFADSGLLPKPDVISTLFEHFRNTGVGAAGGAFDIANRQFLLSRLLHAEQTIRQSEKPRETETLTPLNALFRKKALLEAGGFDDGFTATLVEDESLSAKIRAAGYKMVFDIRVFSDYFFECSLAGYIGREYSHAKWKAGLCLYRRKSGTVPVCFRFLHCIKPLLALFLAVESPLLIFEITRTAYLALLAVYLFLQAPGPLKVTVKTGRPENILLVPVSLLRGFAQGFGLAAGFLKIGR